MLTTAIYHTSPLSAYAVSVLLRNAPIYDTLRERQIARASTAAAAPGRI